MRRRNPEGFANQVRQRWWWWWCLQSKQQTANELSHYRSERGKLQDLSYNDVIEKNQARNFHSYNSQLPSPTGHDTPHVCLCARRRGHGPNAVGRRRRHQQRGQHWSHSGLITVCPKMSSCFCSCSRCCFCCVLLCTLQLHGLYAEFSSLPSSSSSVFPPCPTCCLACSLSSWRLPA